MTRQIEEIEEATMIVKRRDDDEIIDEFERKMTRAQRIGDDVWSEDSDGDRYRRPRP